MNRDKLLKYKSIQKKYTKLIYKAKYKYKWDVNFFNLVAYLYNRKDRETTRLIYN